MIYKKEKFIIHGKQKLKGEVNISAAKNSALKILIATLLTNKKIKLKNLPLKLEDIKTEIMIIKKLGSVIQSKKDKTIIDPSGIKDYKIPMFKERSIRTSPLFIGPLVHRFGKAIIPIPGGDKIGQRPYDLHIYALKRLGINVKVNKNYFIATAKKIKGNSIVFPQKTVGGTENAILTSTLALGKTIIKNAILNPEIVDLINFINKMGGQIKIVNSSQIYIKGVKKLSLPVIYKIIPDRIEALTFLIGAIITNSTIKINNFPKEFLKMPLHFLEYLGANFTFEKNSLMVFSNKKILANFEIVTTLYPGIISDYQPLLTVLATQIEGQSKIIDLKYPERWAYVKELNKMGAKITVKENTAIVNGPTQLKPAKIYATDIRGGAALVLAALCAKGKTIIDNIFQIDRGYEKIDEKLSRLGVKIKRVYA
jgi:UDP-N-acetylglucosamine 1-carboxyvinyltransferase